MRRHSSEPKEGEILCRTGARVGPYDYSQCPVCWSQLNDPRLMTKTDSTYTGPLYAECCGKSKRDLEYEVPERVITINNGSVIWSYGITTVPERGDLLRKTQLSLAAGGFDRPQIFVERGMRAIGTWWLAALELYLRNPQADRYAIFQDDILVVKNLRGYLDKVPHPEKGYWNLYATRENDDIIRGKGPGFYESAKVSSSSPTSDLQTGRGALGLVFPRWALIELLMARHFVERPMDGEAGTKNIDGGIVTAMNKAGYREFIHSPSLVQHTGDESAIGGKSPRRRFAKSFPGEGFDAMSWLK